MMKHWNMHVYAVPASSLTHHLWVCREVEAYANLGITNRWMFGNPKGELERMGFYEAFMFGLIQRVH
jgi:hypothetical protein